MIDTGQWIFGDLLQNGSITHISNFDNGVNREHYEVNPDTVGQFTGLVDKNGKEIYEGDIVNCDWRRHQDNSIKIYSPEKIYISQIIYANDIAGFHVIAKRGLILLTKTRCKRNLEVIGNVHDNPELI